MSDPSLAYKPLSDLTDHDIASLTAELKDQEASQRPLVGQLEPLDHLREEYARGSSVFVAKIDRLKQDGWTGLRRARGDGDCFYRSA